jgi:hypothetical protein
MRTGAAGEFGLALGVVLVCWALSGQIAAPSGGYLSFFPDWAASYEAGTATAKERQENRFRFF